MLSHRVPMLSELCTAMPNVQVDMLKNVDT